MSSRTIPLIPVRRSKTKTEDVAGEIPIPTTHSDEVVVTSGQKRSSPEESCEMDVDGTGGERAARRARLALVEQMVLHLHRTHEEGE